MNRILIMLVLGALALPATAQKFGHIDTQELLMAMPEREKAQEQLEAQATMYEEQLKGMQSELQRKYEDYLAKSETWPEAIRKTKEKELNQLQQGMQDFSQTAQQDLAKLEDDLLTPMIDRAREAIENVGKENGFTYIFDSSTGVTVYNGGEDVTALVKTKLGLK
jgi:outer membrane protein